MVNTDCTAKKSNSYKLMPGSASCPKKCINLEMYALSRRQNADLAATSSTVSMAPTWKARTAGRRSCLAPGTRLSCHNRERHSKRTAWMPSKSAIGKTTACFTSACT